MSSIKKSENKVKNQGETQLSDVETYDVNKMIFSDPVVTAIPGSIPPVNFKRILISTEYPDGSIGDLIFSTNRCYSFGVNENLDSKTKLVNGYTMPICLYNRDGPSKEEKQWVNMFNKIVDHAKKHMIDNREDLDCYDLEMSNLKKLGGCMYWKMEKGKVVEGTGPTLYAKLISQKKDNKILTMFTDKDGNPVDPLSLMKQHCFVTAAVKFESIYIGADKYTLQLKLYEAQVEVMQNRMKPLLTKRPQSNNLLNSSASLQKKNSKEENKGDDIIVSDDENQTEKPVVQTSAPVVRKTIKKITKPT